MTTRILKYPRTHHLEGSRLQPGDEDLDAIPFRELESRFVVIEEKVDGANSAFSFDSRGELLLQSRGHYLVGGYRERHFDLFKRWAHTHRESLWSHFRDRYVVYGEWLYAKHTVFYDRLPHYFLEFDIWDRYESCFLSTDRRRSLLEGAPIVSVPVLWEGTPTRLDEVIALVGPSRFKSCRWSQRLPELAVELKFEVDQVMNQTDSSSKMEGLYIKCELNGVVDERLKWIRASFLSSVVESSGHWLDRPILPNKLAPGVDLFEPSNGSPDVVT